VSVRIAPSLLAANFIHLGDEVSHMEAAAVELLHVDVMDGRFVPNITFGLPIVKALKAATNIPLDVHLMIVEPERYIADFAAAGASVISVHVEACPHLDATIRRIHDHGLRAGVAINPATPVHALDEIVELVDVVLVMSVNPGFTGQAFLPSSLRRIEAISTLIEHRGSRAAVQVDGGVDASNISQVCRAGASIVVAGAAIFHRPDPVAAVAELRQAAAG
jgi:ribulose-phosphate 3-epimerase